MANPNQERIQYPLRITEKEHEKWKTFAREAGWDLRTLIIISVRFAMKNRDQLLGRLTPPADLPRKEINDLRLEITKMSKLVNDLVIKVEALETVAGQDRKLEELAYERTITEQIYVFIKEKPHIKKCRTKAELVDKIRKADPTLEPFLVSTANRPISLLDHVLAQLEREGLVKVSPRGSLQWLETG